MFSRRLNHTFRSGPRLLKDVALETQMFQSRAVQGFAIIGILLTLLVGRYVWLQVIRHSEWSTQSEQNRIKSLPLPPSRGLIYDRNGLLLAENILEYRLEIIPEQAGEVAAVVDRIGKIIVINSEERERFEELRKARHRFNSLPLKFHLTEDEVARFAVNRHRFPGIEVVPYLKRYYPLGTDLAHVVGYVGRLAVEDRERLDDPRYRATTHIGKTGIERFYEDTLLGKVGYEQIETNAEGRALRVLGRVAPTPGQHLHLTLDARLQQAAIAAFAGRPGVAVALDPRNGEILCMVSQPGFDPNLFVNGISRKDYAALLNAPYRPLFDRALLGGYEPGSAIKPFIALAGLEFGLRTPETSVVSTGQFRLPGQHQIWRDWRAGGHGNVNLQESLAQSVNTYYYQLAFDLGVDRMHGYLAGFGFGVPTGVDLNGEASGVLPSRAWKQGKYAKAWYPGDTVNAGIGQGYWVVTPIQLASALATLAAGGIHYRPHLVRAMQSGINAPMTLVPSTVVDRVPIKNPEHWAAVRAGMIAVMHSPTGTGRALGQNALFVIAGKTGTAQRVNIARRAAGGGLNASEKLRNQALFIAYAPAENPTIALAVVVEHGDSGPKAAAPIARRILDVYLLGEAAATVVIPDADIESVLGEADTDLDPEPPTGPAESDLEAIDQEPRQ